MSILLFIFAITPFTYMLSFFFKNPTGAQRITAMLYVILGVALFITSWILSLNNVEWNDDLQPLYRIFPTYLLSDAIYAIALRDIVFPGKSYWDWKVVGRDLTFMTYQGFGYFGLLLLIEWSVFCL